MTLSTMQFVFDHNAVAERSRVLGNGCYRQAMRCLGYANKTRHDDPETSAWFAGEFARYSDKADRHFADALAAARGVL